MEPDLFLFFFEKLPIDYGRFESLTSKINTDVKYYFDRIRKDPPKIPNTGNLHQIRRKLPALSYYFPRTCFIDENKQLTVILPRPSSLPQVKSLGMVRKFTLDKSTIANRKRKDRCKAGKSSKFKKALKYVEYMIRKSTTFELAGKELMSKLIFESTAAKVRNINLIAIIGFYLSKLATVAAANKLNFTVENLTVPETYFKMLKLPTNFDEKKILDDLVKQTSKLIDKSLDEDKTAVDRLEKASSKFLVVNENEIEKAIQEYEPPSPTVSQMSTSQSLDEETMKELDFDDAEIKSHLRKIYSEREIDELLKSDDEEGKDSNKKICIESVEKLDSGKL